MYKCFHCSNEGTEYMGKDLFSLRIVCVECLKKYYDMEPTV